MSILRFSELWVLDDHKPFRSCLEAWQRDFLAEATRQGDDGPAYKRILCSLPRQSSKTEMAALFGCWRTLTVGGATVSIARDLDQCRLQHARLVRAIRRSPTLACDFDLRNVRGNTIWRKDGRGYWAFLPSDEASAGGHVVATLIADEIGQFPKGSWSFISQVSPSPAVAHGQAFFCGFKGPIQHRTPGAPLFDLLAQGEAGASDLFVYNVEGRSPASWHTDQFLSEQRTALPSASFKQLYRNEWAEHAEQFLPVTMVEAAVDPSLDRNAAPNGEDYVFLGLDCGLVNDATVLSAAAISGAGGDARLIRQRTWAGSRDAPVDLSEVEETAEQWFWELGASALIGDPWQSIHMKQRLQARGVTVEIFHFTAGSVEQLASGVYELFARGRVKIPDDPALAEELLGLTTRQTTSGYKWTHPSGGHDDRVVSMALSMSPLFQPDDGEPDEVVFSGNIEVQNAEGFVF